MVKFYKIDYIEVDEQKIDKGEPIEVSLVTENGHHMTLSLVLKHSNKGLRNHEIRLSFEHPIDHPLHDSVYIFGKYDTREKVGKLRIYNK